MRPGGQQLRGELAELVGPRRVADGGGQYEATRHGRAGVTDQRRERGLVRRIRADRHERDSLPGQQPTHGDGADPGREVVRTTLGGQERVPLGGEGLHLPVEPVGLAGGSREEPFGHPSRTEDDPERQGQEDRGDGHHVVTQGDHPNQPSICSTSPSWENQATSASPASDTSSAATTATSTAVSISRIAPSESLLR